MAVLEALRLNQLRSVTEERYVGPILTVDSLGRVKRVCPTCGKRKFPGKAFADSATECVTCVRTRRGVAFCKSCGLEKPLDQFPSRGISRSGDLKLWRCKECTRSYQAAWAKANPERVSAYSRKHQIGVTDVQYRAAIEQCENTCPICSEPFTETPHADHDHVTGEFRGVLCRRCNNGLGQFADDIERLRRAIDYLGAFNGGA